MMAVSADWTMSKARMSGRTSLVTVTMKARTVRVMSSGSDTSLLTRFFVLRRDLRR